MFCCPLCQRSDVQSFTFPANTADQFLALAEVLEAAWVETESVEMVLDTPATVTAIAERLETLARKMRAAVRLRSTMVLDAPPV